MTRLRRLLVPVLLILLGGTVVSATTIVPLSDAALVDRATVVIEGTADAQLPTVLERPVTDWLVRVDRVLKGETGTSSIVVRLPGGRAAGGRHLRIHGAPPIRAGHRLLLFLAPKGDGTWAVIDFPQGAFVAGRARSRNLAFRDFSQVRQLGRSRVGVRDPLRDADRFADWIEDRADGLPRPRDYVVQPRASELQALAQRFTLLDHQGVNLRWFVFDLGGAVSWWSYADGQPELDGGGTAELQRALAAWTDESSTPLRLIYGGTTTSKGGLGTFDSQNVVHWNDPNDEIEGAFDCSEGGTLASGGPWFDPDERSVFDGRSYIPISGGDVVMNDGIECWSAFSPDFSRMIEEVVAHEIGHTLGLGHSSENLSEADFQKRDALMYFRAHDDRRGARLTADDVSALRALYLRGGGGGGGGGGSDCAADTLCLLQGRYRVTVTWSNQFDGSSGIGRPISRSDLTGFFYFTDPRNVELILKILDFGSEIKVFYSQLTNLRFEITVIEVATGRSKIYRNTAGECGAIDQNFQAGAASLASPLLDGLVSLPQPVTGTCLPTPGTLCLLNDRFSVTLDWRNQFNGAAGVGRPTHLSDLSGAFYFDDPANLEVLIKALDFTDRRLVLWGSLSNLEYTLHVTDTVTGQSKEYANPADNFCGGIDESF